MNGNPARVGAHPAHSFPPPPLTPTSSAEIGVSIVPAHTLFTRMWYLAKSYAQLRASWHTAPFIAAYVAQPGWAR